MGRTAVFPGTFDPVTLGHLDLVRRGARLFDRLVVAVAEEGKETLFPVEERVALLRSAVADLPSVSVEPFSGLVVELARRRGATVLLRGVRTFQDWEYELRMAHTNRALAPDVETLFLVPSAPHAFLSSSLTREVASLGGDVSAFVPPGVAAAISKAIERRRGRSGR
jgi:pantetheine-phosphate adenylyltransferase